MTDGIAGTAPRRPVLVGYDGSDGAKRAVLWASRYAGGAQLPLVVVHCWPWPFFTHDLGPAAGVQDSGLRREAEKLLAEGQDLAGRAEPELLVSSRLVVGFPSEALTRLSAEASLLVTGTRGLGGFGELLIGSVSLRLASSASCPVMVVREARPICDTVIAAVDGSPASDRATATAADLARTLHKRLELLHVRVQRRRKAADAPLEGRDPVLERAAALLAGIGELSVTEDSAAGHSAAGEIVQWTATACSVILGARGADAAGARLGSTVHAVLHHARGNIGIVP
ncbi:universal stress protein [Arthrobacter ruber]|uniref:universal stress protein n=1 Tax=Arthrobacter ruber TaxID=1258893 RepID=UPI001473EA0F|nr:universal stress protein [Arthrobacter ruber]